MLELVWAVVILTVLVLLVTLFIRTLRTQDQRRRDRDRVVHSIFDEEEGKK